MSFNKEIEQSLEQIQSLAEHFRRVRDMERLPLSFFSSSFDILIDLTVFLHELESSQFKLMEELLLKQAVLVTEEEKGKKVEVLSKTEPTPVFLENTIKKQLFSDLKKSLSLNDRFLFQRELFKGDPVLMNDTLDHLNTVTTLKESIDYLDQKLHWSWESETALVFKALLETHFL